MDRTRRAIDFRADLLGAPQEITVSLSVFAVVVDRNVRLRIIGHGNRPPGLIAAAVDAAPRDGTKSQDWALGSANPGAFYFVVLTGNTRNTLDDHEQKCWCSRAMSIERACGKTRMWITHSTSELTRNLVEYVARMSHGAADAQ
jgi:hypothetical protein